jgi:hypothetical protein
MACRTLLLENLPSCTHALAAGPLLQEIMQNLQGNHDMRRLQHCAGLPQQLAALLFHLFITLSLLACLQERAFELGERLDVLSQVNQPSIIPHMAEFEGKRFPYEVRPGRRLWEWAQRMHVCFAIMSI